MKIIKKAYFYSFLFGLASGLPLFVAAPVNYRIGGYLIGAEKRALGIEGAAVSNSFYAVTFILLLALVFFFANAIFSEFGGFKKYSHREIVNINAFFALGILVSVGLFAFVVAAIL